MTWLHYSRIILSWWSEVNIGKGVWMLLQEMKFSAYMAIFILHFVCLNRKWAHIYLLSIARGRELQGKYSSSLQRCSSWKTVSLNSCCLALHLCFWIRMERAKTHWDVLSACKLTCCSIVGGEKWGKKDCSCWVRRKSSLLSSFFTVGVHPGSWSCGPGTSSTGWAGKGAPLWGMHTASISVLSTVPHIAFPTELYWLALRLSWSRSVPHISSVDCPKAEGFFSSLGIFQQSADLPHSNGNKTQLKKLDFCTYLE